MPRYHQTAKKSSLHAKEVTFSADSEDPRQRCCHGGERFLLAIKAMITRMLFLLHGLLSVWRVHERLGNFLWWLFVIPFLALIVEALVVLLYRRGKEWKWVSPCVLIYLLCVLPPIWVLMLESTTNLIQGTTDRSANSTTNRGSDAISSDSEGRLVIQLSEQEWAYLMEQTILVCIIIGRWLMPKGDITRNQLSALLLNYVAIASDIVDLFGVLEEEDKLTETYVIIVLTFWSWSMFQFVFTNTVTRELENEEPDVHEDANVAPSLDKVYGDHSTNVGQEQQRRKSLWNKFISSFLETDAWAIFVSMLMQDGPYLVVRLIGLLYYHIATYTMFFFIVKNILLLVLQVYRITVLHHEHEGVKKADKMKEQQIMKKLYKRISFQNSADLARIAPEFAADLKKP